MSQDLNTLRWDRTRGQYEVYYLSLTDPASGYGLWIRYTLLAPLPETGLEPTASLWFMAMRPGDPSGPLARKISLPATELETQSNPFSLSIGQANLSDHGMRGEFEDVAWDLTWISRAPGVQHVHPLMQRAKIAKTVLVLPHPDLKVSGTVRFGSQELTLDGAYGSQAHLWGSKHAGRWAWLHCNDLLREDGEHSEGDFIDGVSVIVPRFGREVGPATPFVGRFDEHDFRSIGPLAVARNQSSFNSTSWQFTARERNRKVVGKVVCDADTLVGVTYQDPDGDLAYCYNSEVASLELDIYHRAGGGKAWTLARRLNAPHRAHFEFAQREKLPDRPLHV